MPDITDTAHRTSTAKKARIGSSPAMSAEV
jgi:hypothetical protein